MTLLMRCCATQAALEARPPLPNLPMREFLTRQIRLLLSALHASPAASAASAGPAPAKRPASRSGPMARPAPGSDAGRFGVDEPPEAEGTQDIAAAATTAAAPSTLASLPASVLATPRERAVLEFVSNSSAHSQPTTSRPRTARSYASDPASRPATARPATAQSSASGGTSRSAPQVLDEVQAQLNAFDVDAVAGQLRDALDAEAEALQREIEAVQVRAISIAATTTAAAAAALAADPAVAAGAGGRAGLHRRRGAHRAAGAPLAARHARRERPAGARCCHRALLRAHAAAPALTRAAGAATHGHGARGGGGSAAAAGQGPAAVRARGARCEGCPRSLATHARAGRWTRRLDAPRCRPPRPPPARQRCPAQPPRGAPLPLVLPALAARMAATTLAARDRSAAVHSACATRCWTPGICCDGAARNSSSSSALAR